MKNWFQLILPPVTSSTSLKAGIGAGIAIGCLFLLSQFSGELLISANLKKHSKQVRQRFRNLRIL